MLPLRLLLKNFLPYRTPDELSFDGIHLACLTGPNGAGKSALLDAITWALWGKARNNTLDDLIHLGQEEMIVQLDFEQEGSIYRVRRARSRGKRSQSQLDFWARQEDGHWSTLNEGSVRETQQRIEALLRLSFDLFTHSAFLQQGQANAFTIADPAKRKQLLGSILGLEAWSVYEDRAKKQLSELEIQRRINEDKLRSIDEELAREPQYRRDLEAAAEALKAAEEAVQHAEAQLKLVERAPDDLRRAQDDLASHERRLKGYDADVSAAVQEIERRQGRIADYQRALDEAERIESGYATLQDARARSAELTDKLRDLQDLNKQQTELQRQLDQQRAELENQRSGHQAAIAQLESHINGSNTEALSAVQAAIASLEKVEAARETLYQQAKQQGEQRSANEATLRTMKLEGEKLNRRIDQLKEVDDPLCPLCGQPLDEAHRADIIAQITTEVKDLRVRYLEISEQIKATSRRLQEMDSEQERLSLELAELPRLRSQAGGLEQQQRSADEAREQLQQQQAELAAVQTTLDSEDYGHALREQLAALEAERQRIGYDDAAFASNREQLDEYAGYEKEFSELSNARKQLPEEEKGLQEAQARHERFLAAADEERAARDACQQRIEELKPQVEEYNQRAQELSQQRTQREEARNRHTIASQQLAALDMDRKRRAEIETEMQTIAEERSLYEDLKKAFGKNGVPLMMIEAAIPELEAAANELLGRMTDGRMHLRLETEREKKSGGSAETLEIRIADELGTRPYELYSGGEAFRIDFALRVALSKMLARRAGAQLRTLFVDEGFGTQDDDGRSKLVEAITAVADEFDLILVITHIDDLRDAFPVHVVVSKTQSGSSISVR